MSKHGNRWYVQKFYTLRAILTDTTSGSRRNRTVLRIETLGRFREGRENKPRRSQLTQGSRRSHVDWYALLPTFTSTSPDVFAPNSRFRYCRSPTCSFCMLRCDAGYDRHGPPFSLSSSRWCATRKLRRRHRQKSTESSDRAVYLPLTMLTTCHTSNVSFMRQ